MAEAARRSARVAAVRWVVQGLIAAPAILVACGGTLASSTQNGEPSRDGGRDGSASGTRDAGAATPGDAEADAGCSHLYDVDDTAISSLLRQYGTCQVASDCTALPVLDYCVVVSAAGSTGFMAAVSAITRGLEQAGCSPTAIPCDAVQVKCAGSCTSVGKLSPPD